MSFNAKTRAALISLTDNFFVLFGLPERFELDGVALDAAWHAVQTRTHPDRFAQASDADKRRAMQWTMHVNEAHATLKHPVKRAAYLCRLRGIDPQAESNTSMPPAFLMQQMAWREALEEAYNGNDSVALSALDDEVRAARRAAMAELADCLDTHNDTEQAALVVRKLMFVDKFAAEVGDALHAAES